MNALLKLVQARSPIAALLPLLLFPLFVPSRTAQAQPLAAQPLAAQPLAAQPFAAQPFVALPDAPLPQLPPGQSDSRSGTASPKAATTLAHAPFQERKWAQYVDPGERVPRLDAKDKWVFWLHEEARLATPLPALFSAGYGQLTDDDPKYGTDSGAFGDRFAAGLVRDATMHFFSGSLFPVVYGEDPRYYRRARGSYKKRAFWAFKRVFITQRDSGGTSVNGSLLAGHLAASALTLSYYPHDSRNSGVVLRTWGLSIAGAAVNNQFLEFWPDVTNLWRQRRLRERASRSSVRSADR